MLFFLKSVGRRCQVSREVALWHSAGYECQTVFTVEGKGRKGREGKGEEPNAGVDKERRRREREVYVRGIT